MKTPNYMIIKYAYVYLLVLCFFVGITNTLANVTVTSAGNLNLCVGTTYTTIGNITIQEGGATDFSASGAIQTYEINAPSNFEFNPGSGSVTSTGADIIISSLTVTSSKITLSYYLNTTATTDKFVLSNLQIRATNSSGSQNIVRTGGDAVQTGNAAHANVHGSVSANQANITLIPSQTVVCTSAADISLNGSPNGGTYTGSSAIVGTNFKPALSGSGIFTITYTASQNGCTKSATVNITVNPAPSVTFFGLGSSYCSADSTNYQLTGFPSGGTFSGSGIVNTSFFYPPAAGAGNNKPITYQYSANGCQTSTTLQTNVKQSPSATTVTLSLAQTNFFNTDDSILIDGNPSYLALNGGALNVSGNGVATDNAGVSRFYPKVIGQGSSVITRTYTAPNGCSTTGSLSVTVTNSTGGVIGGITDTVCKTANPFTMTVANDYGYYMAYYYNTSFGYVLDNAVLTDTDHSNGIGLFDPKKASIGTYLIYFLGTQNGLTSKLVQVRPPPVVAITNINSTYCSNIKEFTIQYVKNGYGNGNISFSGLGVNNGKFDPSSITTFSVATNINYNYSDASGCTSSGSAVTKIYQSPNGVGFDNLSDKYCSSSSPSILIPKSNITPAGAGSFSGVGLAFNDALQPVFNPNIILNTTSVSKEYTLTYTYITNDGCKVDSSKKTTVYVVPEVNLNGLNAAYCLGKDTVVLNGSPGSNGGTFSIAALAPATAQSGILYNNNRLVISKMNVGTYYLTYTYTDQTTNCLSSDTDTTIIRNVPNVVFSNLDTSYCMAKISIPLFGSPLGTGGDYSSLTADVSDISKLLDIEKSGVGKHEITYTYTDEFGCSASQKQITTIYGSPKTINGIKTPVQLSSVCENDLITLKDFNSSIESNSDALSFIKTANWIVDTTSLIKGYKDEPLIKLNSGNHKIVYKLITDKGCNTTFDTTISIGSYPKTKFTWDEICNNTKTKFKNVTPGLEVGKVDKVIWDFSDPLDPSKININLTSTINGDTSHTYITPTIYKVFLTAYSDYKCVTKDSQNVFILDSKTIKKSVPYSNDFNDLVSDWVSATAVDTIPSSWTLGVPNKKHIHATDGAWVTNLNKSYNPDEKSYVYSPCFTIDDSITRPMIHLDVWSMTNLNASGANVQYSLNGRDWKPLGKRNESGINWYNNTGNIASRPSGSELDQDGWTGLDSIDWKNARHIFDQELGTNKNIRFRISFAGNKDTTGGFAFDNIWIGDRTRLILAEHFTNNTNNNTVLENNALNNLVSANLLNNEPKDIVKLEYHTAFPGPDQMNVRNIPDAGARSLYYGVTQTPYSVIDGSYYKGNTLGINQKTIDTRSLYDPAFEIRMNPLLTSTAVSGSVTIKNKIPVVNNVTVYISVLERFVNGVSGSNGESSYQWVHAKFLPDAAGTTFAPNWTTQNSQTVNFNWNFNSNNLYDPNKLAIIAFVQDNVTKEIYQAAYKGIGATVTTGVFDPLESTSTVTLYPNPANDITTVILNGKLAGEYTWLIIDELGRTVGEGVLADGTDGFAINTQNYASGFYTIRISNGSVGVKTQKFVVLH